MEKSKLTQAEESLFELIKEDNIEDFYKSLKVIHFLGTYRVEQEYFHPFESSLIHDLLDAFQRVVIERKINKGETGLLANL